MHHYLRRFVTANALFSLATGALLASIPGTVGGWLGVEVDGWLRLLGLGLIGHFVALWWARNRDNLATWARLNLLVIAPYPLLMVGLVGLGVIDRDLGKTLALTDGLMVGVLAWGHRRALRQGVPATSTVS